MVDDVKKVWFSKNLPIELTAATTDGSSMHIGIIYFLWLILIIGTTANGKDNLPITFYIIESASYKLRPPLFNKLKSIVF